MKDVAIEIEKVSKHFEVPVKKGDGLLASMRQLVNGERRTVIAVDNVSMKVPVGEIRGLIGPNGAGKSTIIKMISGIIHPTGGNINVMGFVPWKQRKEYVRHIGVLLGQKTQLYWDLPAIDTFRLNKTIYRLSDSVYKTNISYFCDILRIGDVIKIPVRNLSLGERIKCEIVCALLHNPRLVFLDEPTIGLDVFAKEGIREFIRQINRDKSVTFILTTHDLSEIESLCENVTVINKGTIVYDDSIVNMRKLYTSRKCIDVMFSHSLPSESLQKFNVRSFTPLSATFEVDNDSECLRDEIARIFSELPVQDITVSDPDIEEIIREIYRR